MATTRRSSKKNASPSKSRTPEKAKSHGKDKLASLKKSKSAPLAPFTVTDLPTYSAAAAIVAPRPLQIFHDAAKPLGSLKREKIGLPRKPTRCSDRLRLRVKTDLDPTWRSRPYYRLAIWATHQSFDIILPPHTTSVDPGTIDFLHILVTKNRPELVDDSSIFYLSAAPELGIPAGIDKAYLEFDFTDLENDDHFVAHDIRRFQRLAFRHMIGEDADDDLISQLMDQRFPAWFSLTMRQDWDNFLLAPYTSDYYEAFFSRVRDALEYIIRVSRFEVQQVAVHWYSEEFTKNGDVYEEGDPTDALLDELLDDLRSWFVACKLRVYDLDRMSVLVYQGTDTRATLLQNVDPAVHITRLGPQLWTDIQTLH